MEGVQVKFGPSAQGVGFESDLCLFSDLILPPCFTLHLYKGQKTFDTCIMHVSSNAQYINSNVFLFILNDITICLLKC